MHRFGHDVVVAAPNSLAGAVRRAGFAHAPFADPAPAVRDTVTADIPALAPHEANVRVMRDVLARLDATAALPGLQALIGAWRPDVIVRETFEYGSYVAAERNDIPHAQVDVVLAWYEDLGLSVVEAPLNALRASVGLGPDLGLVGLRAAPHLTCAPESLEHPAAPGPGDTHRFCVGSADRPGPAVTDWWYGSRAPLEASVAAWRPHHIADQLPGGVRHGAPPFSWYGGGQVADPRYSGQRRGPTAPVRSA